MQHSYVCKAYQGETPPSVMAEECLMGDVKKEARVHDIVDSFGYLGDMLSTKGRADEAGTTRGRCAWKKSGEPDLMPHHVLNVQREIDYDSHEGQGCMVCIRRASCLLYG